MDRTFITLAALSGFLAVALGAFGAHALRERLSADMLQVFQTGVTYQMYHALGLLAVGILLARFSVDGSIWLTGAGWLFVERHFLVGRDYAAGWRGVLARLAGTGYRHLALTVFRTGPDRPIVMC